MQRIIRNIDWIVTAALLVAVTSYIRGYGSGELGALGNFIMLPVPEGEPREVLELAEGTAILHFMETECNPCRRDAQELLRFHRRHADIQVLGIGSGTDTREELDRWSSALGLSYPLFQADRDEVERLAGIDMLPSTILVGEGKKLAHIRGELSYNQLLAYTGRDK